MDNEQNNTDIQPESTSKGVLSAGRSFLNKKLIFPAVAVFIVILVIAGVLLLGKKPASPVDVTALVNSGKNSLASGNYIQAKSDFTTALESKKNDPEILTHLIEAISIQGNQNGNEEKALEESMPYIDAALKSGNNDPKTLMAVGYAYETAGEYKKASTYYDRAVELDPQSSNAWFHKGHNLEFLGKKDEAYSCYDKSYSLDPNNPLALMARGNQLMSRGDLQGSYQSFRKASTQPGLEAGIKAEALTAAASVRGTQDNFKYINETLQLSKEAVDVAPNFSPALSTYGYTLYLTTPVNGDKTQAIDYVKRAISANPRISKNYLILSMFYRGQKDFTNAISYNKQAIDRADEDNALLSPKARVLNKGTYEYELAKTYYLSGQRELVIPTIKLAIQDNPYIKQTIKNDFSNGGQFTDFATNGEFISLITE